MKLFFMPGACSLSPLIVMPETGLDFTLINHDCQDYLSLPNPCLSSADKTSGK